MQRLKDNQSGQSLIELIVSIAVITIGLFSVWFLFLVNFNAEKEAEMRIVAANLAREGAEITKNTRDSNWLRMANNITGADSQDLWLWDRGLGSGNYVADYINGLIPLADDGTVVLYYDDHGYYAVKADDPNQLATPFSRQIVLTSICCADSSEDQKCDDTEYFITDADCPSKTLRIGVHVSSRVTWTYSAQPRQLVVEDELFNWR